MPQPVSLHIAYGSESGNAHSLAIELKDKLKNFSPELLMLDELAVDRLSQWTSQDLFLIVTSTTGNGEAPYNANQFYQALVQKRMKLRMKADTNTIDCRYAVFGIGDSNYDNFCGFAKILDGLLGNCGATAVANPVYADVDYQAFFEQWSEAVLDYVSAKEGAENSLTNLRLQADPHG